jgi:hypothetical protein
VNHRIDLIKVEVSKLELILRNKLWSVLKYDRFSRPVYLSVKLYNLSRGIANCIGYRPTCFGWIGIDDHHVLRHSYDLRNAFRDIEIWMLDSLADLWILSL